MLNGARRHAKDQFGMLLRLVLGLLKGLAIGGLVGFGLAKVGLAAPSALFAYAAAALVGALVGLIAGKPIWAADGRIEAGLKAGFGALLATGLMALARNFLGFAMPIDLGSLAAANQSLGETSAQGTIGGLAIVSLSLVAALIGAFYDADNTPEPEGEKKAVAGNAPKARIAAKPAAADELDEFEEEEAPKNKAKK
jgi:hypothetical protein